MKLYQITLPLFDNRGASYSVAHQYFRERALDAAGGYTDCGEVEGQWYDPTGSCTYGDRLRVYQIACEPDAWNELVAYAKRQFIDQVCLAVATLGDFELV